MIEGRFVEATEEEAKELILQFLASHGPATEEQIAAWLKLRLQHEIEAAVLELFEQGRVDVWFPDPDESAYVVRAV